MIEVGGEFGALANLTVPSAAVTDCARLIDLMERLAANPNLQSQVRLAREFYTPYLEQKFDHTEPRLLDLEQLEQVAVQSRDRQTFLSEMVLDQPKTSEDFAGEPLLNEDDVILSTIYSATGLEWDSVYVIYAADGKIPSDLATRNEAEIEEERRLFYVALTWAKNRL